MGKHKNYEKRQNFYKCHLDRQSGVRGRKSARLSLREDLRRLGRALGIPVYIDR